MASDVFLTQDMTNFAKYLGPTDGFVCEPEGDFFFCRVRTNVARGFILNDIAKNVHQYEVLLVHLHHHFRHF
ncbi:hypothetical protein ASF91_22985 [Rhizobium sp. Leaf155]|nr:hypothetical protein ASF91_22985 [Rhizobium sp. Leaf155]